MTLQDSPMGGAHISNAEIKAFREKYREIFPGSHPDRQTIIELLTASKAAVSAASEAFRSALAASPAVPSSVEAVAAIALAESRAAMSHNELLRLVRAFRDECIRQEIKFGPLIADADAALSRPVAEGAVAVKALEWNTDMGSAPKDGTMLLLLVRPVEDGSWTPLVDSWDPHETIGFNNLGNTGEDEWQFAGWNWNQDCFTDGKGEIVGWLPFGALVTHPLPQAGAEIFGWVKRSERDGFPPSYAFTRDVRTAEKWQRRGESPRALYENCLPQAGAESELVEPVAWHCVGSAPGWAENKIIQDPETAAAYQKQPDKWTVTPLGPAASIAQLQQRLAEADSGDRAENTTDNPKSWIAWKRRAEAAAKHLQDLCEAYAACNGEDHPAYRRTRSFIASMEKKP